MSKPWSVHHLELDGAGVDRDNEFPDVEFELHPMGTELPEEEQRHELVIVINPEGHGERRTRLDTNALRDLMKFLNESAKV